MVVDLFAVLAPSAVEMKESEIVLRDPEAPKKTPVRLVDEALPILLVSSTTNHEL